MKELMILNAVSIMWSSIMPYRSVRHSRAKSYNLQRKKRSH